MQLSEGVVKRLMTESFLNVTCDNFFTSKILCGYLLINNTSLLGTIRINRLEMPQNLKQILQSCNLHKLIIMQSDTCTHTSYKCKKKKFVTVLSSLRETVSFEGAKRKPITVIDYDHTKYGVDIVDAMARLYTTKASSRR